MYFFVGVELEVMFGKHMQRKENDSLKLNLIYASKKNQNYNSFNVHFIPYVNFTIRHSLKYSNVFQFTINQV